MTCPSDTPYTPELEASEMAALIRANRQPPAPRFMGDPEPPDAQERAEQEIAYQESEAEGARAKPPWAEADVLSILDAEDDALAPIAGDYQEAAARVLADRYLRVLAGVERRMAVQIEEHRAYLAHLDLVHVARTAPLLRTATWLKLQLEHLFRFIPTGKAKSVKLLAGRLGTRHQNAHLFVQDAEAALAWADAALPSAVHSQTVQMVEQAELEHYALSTGEVPPGCELKPASDDFYAKPAIPGKEG